MDDAHIGLQSFAVKFPLANFPAEDFIASDFFALGLSDGLVTNRIDAAVVPASSKNILKNRNEYRHYTSIVITQ